MGAGPACYSVSYAATMALHSYYKPTRTATNCERQAFAVPTESTGGHPDTPLVPLQHEHAEVAAREARASTKALQWIGPIAPNGEVYAYYGGLQVRFTLSLRRYLPLTSAPR